MHQLVMEHPAVVAITAKKWYCDAILEKLRYATDALGVNRQVDRIRDGKRIMAVIHQDGNPLADAMAEKQFDLPVRVFSRMSRKLREVLGLFEEVNIKVAGGQVVPLSRLVRSEERRVGKECSAVCTRERWRENHKRR